MKLVSFATTRVLIFSLLGLICGTLHSQLLIVDGQTLEPIPFVTFYSLDQDCSGYADENGLINSCLQYDLLTLDHIGYDKSEIHRDLLVDTLQIIRLNKTSYSMEEIIVKEKRINLYPEINRLIKVRKKNKSYRHINSVIFIESKLENRLVERIQFVSQDLWKANSGLTPEQRSFGQFYFDPASPFITTDTDQLIKTIHRHAVNFYHINHIFSKNKIRPTEFDLKLLEINEAEDRMVRYKSKKQDIAGLINYNAGDNVLKSHQYTLHSDLDKIFKPLNSNFPISSDSLVIYATYNSKGKLDFISFGLHGNVDDGKGFNKKITTLGYIRPVFEEIVFGKIVYPPGGSYKSIQEELFFTPYTEEHADWLTDHSLSMHNQFSAIPNEDLLSDASLVYRLLKHFNALKSNSVLWSHQRLNIEHFSFIESRTDFGSSIPFKSDLMQYQVNWIFTNIKDTAANKYISMPSIWHIDQAKMLYNTPNQVLLLTNLVFDTYEIYRKKCLIELNAKNNNINYTEIISDYYKMADDHVREMKRKTRLGRHLDELLVYNNWVFNMSGVDNIAVIGTTDILKLKQRINTYSSGDVLTFFEQYEEAKAYYLNILNSDFASDTTLILNVLNNLMYIALLQGECDVFDKYKQEINKLSNGQIVEEATCK